MVTDHIGGGGNSTRGNSLTLGPELLTRNGQVFKALNITLHPTNFIELSQGQWFLKASIASPEKWVIENEAFENYLVDFDSEPFEGSGYR